jgi:hypothetical protein
MRSLTDKGLQYRTFPVFPRKRVIFDEGAPVITSLFESDIPIFKCQGGYFSHHSYRLFDFFVSYWFEIFTRKWKEMFGGNFPKKIDDQVIERLSELSPILRLNKFDASVFTDHRIDLFQRLGDYTIITAISDIEMRKHFSLNGLSSKKLFEIIDKTSKARIKTEYPMRVVKEKGKRKILGWESINNISDLLPWSSLFEYRLLKEKTGKDGRVNERIYKFAFNDLIGMAMIHNTICGGTWSVNPKLYNISGDAQLLYRYFVITGSRSRNHRVDYIGHRIGWKEKQKSRLTRCIRRLFEELKESGLILSYDCQNNSHRKIYFSFENLKSTRKSKG